MFSFSNTLSNGVLRLALTMPITLISDKTFIQINILPSQLKKEGLAGFASLIRDCSKTQLLKEVDSELFSAPWLCP